MGVGEIVFWPFFALFMGITTILAIIVLIFLIWMLVDCAKRKFRNDFEKISWIGLMILCNWFGAVVYYIVIKRINKKGLLSK